MMLSFVSSLLTLSALSTTCAQSTEYPTYECLQASCHVTSNAFLHQINRSEITYNRTHRNSNEIKEYHFHVYFFQNSNASLSAARWIQNTLIQKVIDHEFVVVLPGINASILPDLVSSEVPLFNMGPRGPHPCGSFEVWTPQTYLSKVMSFFMMNRGELTILFHPLTENAVQDHFARSMWMGERYRLNYEQLTTEIDEDPPQYKELRLGYHYDVDSPYTPHNWLKK